MEKGLRDARRALLREIEDDVRETSRWTGCGRLSKKVRDAIMAVPREEFVPPTSRLAAYVNASLPIGHGQTISQPFIVAIMTELLSLSAADTVLEIGTGCGYQAAVIARLARAVYSVEVVPDLAAATRTRLTRLGVDNVSVHVGDGRLGWPEHAPYDGVIVTAAGGEIPPALIEQLGPGGRLVAPVGDDRWSQRLVRLTKSADGTVAQRDMLPVAFVPLIDSTNDRR